MTPDPQPLDLHNIRVRWADADRYSGTDRWNPIVAELVAEVERLRSVLGIQCPYDATDGNGLRCTLHAGHTGWHVL